MKIAIFEIEPWERQAFEGLEGEHDLVYESGRLNRDKARLHTDADIVSTFIHSSLKRDVLQQFSDLRLIVTRSTGFDHIDLTFQPMVTTRWPSMSSLCCSRSATIWWRL